MSGGEIWDHINSTLAAVKWPAVVALVGWFLRGELTGLVRRLRKIGAGGATVEFDAKQETVRLGAEISESGGRVVNSAIEVKRVTSYEHGLVAGETSAKELEESAKSAAGDGRGTDVGGLHELAEREALSMLQADLGRLIEASFQAGFVAGVDPNDPGLFRLPSPTVVWSGTEPRIAGWNYTSGESSLRTRLGEELQRIREAAGITRADAGFEIRGSESKISRIERGEIGIRVRDIEALLTLYGVEDGPARRAIEQLAWAAGRPPW